MHYFFCLKFPNTSCEEHRNWNRAYGGLLCGNEKISFVARKIKLFDRCSCFSTSSQAMTHNCSYIESGERLKHTEKLTLL